MGKRAGEIIRSAIQHVGHTRAFGTGQPRFHDRIAGSHCIIKNHRPAGEHDQDDGFSATHACLNQAKIGTRGKIRDCDIALAFGVGVFTDYDNDFVRAGDGCAVGAIGNVGPSGSLQTRPDGLACNPRARTQLSLPTNRPAPTLRAHVVRKRPNHHHFFGFQ